MPRSHALSVSSPAAAENSPQRQRRVLPVLLAGAMLAVSLLITYGVWYHAQQIKQEGLRAEFEFQARDRTTRITRRMATYEQILRGVKGLMNGAIAIDRARLRAYVDALDLGERFPGIQGIGVAEIVPDPQLPQHVAAVRAEGFPDYRVWPLDNGSFHTAVTQIEPFNVMNQRAFGYDMFSNPVRRTAMIQARDTGKAALSGKVTLVQELQTDVQAGVLMYLPVYRRGMPVATLGERRAAIVGWVYAPFRIDDFMRGLASERSSDLAISIYDGNAMSAQDCLFGCGSPVAADPFLDAVSHVEIAGRPWTIYVHATPEFEARASSRAPWLIAVGGIVTSLLLAALVWVLGNSRSRALALALQMTREVRASHNRIAAERRHLKIVLENSYDAFVAIDSAGLVTDWNNQAERIFGWTADEAAGRDLAELIIPEDQRAAHHAGLRRFAQTGTGPMIGRRIEVRAQRRDGSPIVIELAIAVAKSGRAYTSNAFIRDLTERKETERREAESQRALEQARQALQSAQRLESVGKLTGGVAHDFNNVLQIISGNIQLLHHLAGGNAQWEKRLRNMMAAVDRGAKLSSQLLAFARRQPLQPQAINMRRLLSNIDDLLQRALGAEVPVEISAPDDLWNTLVDPNQLENVILNLAINARDAMQGRGTLMIALDNVPLDAAAAAALHNLQPGDYVKLAVSDTGCGMAPEVLAHVFEPFFTTKPEGQGTGLGLSMAYGFVKQSGGHIQIDSAVGQGTTIQILLPRSVDGETPGRTPKKDNDAIAGGSETILVVEDEPDVQETTAALLGGLGYRILRASDGESALQVLRSGERVDLLFSDVVMPGAVSSTELADAARQMMPHLPVLFTSGYTRNAMIHAGRLDPGVHLLGKPYRRDQLAARVRELLDMEKRQAAQA